MLYVTIKDSEGNLLPHAYLETIERYKYNKPPKLKEDDKLVYVEIKEVIHNLE